MPLTSVMTLHLILLVLHFISSSYVKIILRFIVLGKSISDENSSFIVDLNQPDHVCVVLSRRLTCSFAC